VGCEHSCRRWDVGPSWVRDETHSKQTNFPSAQPCSLYGSVSHKCCLAASQTASLPLNIIVPSAGMPTTTRALTCWLSFLLQGTALLVDSLTFDGCNAADIARVSWARELSLAAGNNRTHFWSSLQKPVPQSSALMVGVMKSLWIPSVAADFALHDLDNATGTAVVRRVKNFFSFLKCTFRSRAT
jgi:hypothetical protein